jgi:hypothetical protein
VVAIATTNIEALQRAVNGRAAYARSAQKSEHLQNISYIGCLKAAMCAAGIPTN